MRERSHDGRDQTLLFMNNIRCFLEVLEFNPNEQMEFYSPREDKNVLGGQRQMDSLNYTSLANVDTQDLQIILKHSHYILIFVCPRVLCSKGNPC